MQGRGLAAALACAGGGLLGLVLILPIGIGSTGTIIGPGVFIGGLVLILAVTGSATTTIRVGFGFIIIWITGKQYPPAIDPGADCADHGPHIRIGQIHPAVIDQGRYDSDEVLLDLLALG